MESIHSRSNASNRRSKNGFHIMWRWKHHNHSRFFFSRTFLYTQFYNFIHKFVSSRAQPRKKLPLRGSQTVLSVFLSQCNFPTKRTHLANIETVAGKPLKCLDVHKKLSCGPSLPTCIWITKGLPVPLNGIQWMQGSDIKVKTYLTTGLFTQVLC